MMEKKVAFTTAQIIACSAYIEHLLMKVTREIEEHQLKINSLILSKQRLEDVLIILDEWSHDQVSH